MSRFYQFIFSFTSFLYYLAGLSDDILASEFQHEQAACAASEATNVSSTSHGNFEGKESSNIEDCMVFGLHAEETTVEEDKMGYSGPKELQVKCTPSVVSVEEKIPAEEEDSVDVELGSFFLEDGLSDEGLPHDVYKLQRKEKMREISSEKNLEKLEGIWRKVAYAMQKACLTLFFVI